jgi:hypothetical protein
MKNFLRMFFVVSIFSMLLFSVKVAEADIGEDSTKIEKVAGSESQAMLAEADTDQILEFNTQERENPYLIFEEDYRGDLVVLTKAERKAYNKARDVGWSDNLKENTDTESKENSNLQARNGLHRMKYTK